MGYKLWTSNFADITLLLLLFLKTSAIRFYLNTTSRGYFEILVQYADCNYN